MSDAAIIATANAVSGIGWITAYILIVRRGFLDRTYGMPMVPLALNFSWEFIFTCVHPSAATPTVVLWGWLLIDAVILYQYLKFGPQELGAVLPKGALYGGFALTVIGAYFVQVSIIREIGDWDGAFVGTGINIVMSFVFIGLLLFRRSSRGQSLYIAIFKLIGTQGIYPHAAVTHATTAILPTFHWALLGLDLAYIALPSTAGQGRQVSLEEALSLSTQPARGSLGSPALMTPIHFRLFGETRAE